MKNYFNTINGNNELLIALQNDNLESLLEKAKDLEKKLDLPLGSGYPSDVITQRFLHAWVNKYGSLPPHVRKSWKTASNALNSSKIKKLDRF